MSKNHITGDTMITKPSSTYSENYDAIFRKNKVQFAIEFTDGFQDYVSFNSDDEANDYKIRNHETIVSFEKVELLQE